MANFLTAEPLEGGNSFRFHIAVGHTLPANISSTHY